MAQSLKLIKKADALLAKETGTVYKDPGGKINVCLIYPNTYHVGMSNLGFQGVYTMLNERADTLCERAFLPEPEDMAEYARTKAELFSLESKKPLGRFDLLAFAVPFENDYPNILRMLELSNVPLFAAKRTARHPLVAMGGVCAFSNPEPMADFMDICFVGEAEHMLMQFMDVLSITSGKTALLKNITAIEGVYVPRFYSVAYGPGGLISQRTSLENAAPEVIKKSLLPDLSASTIRPSITTAGTEFSGMYLIEAMRGCPWNCAFCLAGHIYGPARRKSLPVLKAQIQTGLGHSHKVGLIGPSLSDYPGIEGVLASDGVDFSITSLRASPKSARLTKALKGKKSVSIAPEAGTERLRKAIDKKITEQDILETSALMLGAGVEKLRLYFMAGLPGETDEDIDGIVKLTEKIRKTSKKGVLSLTISTFVPKPFTPFQWCSMQSAQVVKARLGRIKKALMPLSGVKVFHDDPKAALMQGFFAMGDRRVSGALAAMLKTRNWEKAAKGAGIDPAFYVTRQKAYTETLPWNFIDAGVDKEKLWLKQERLLGKQ